VKLSGDEPEHLADLLNAIVQAYMREVDGRDTRRRAQLISQLEESKRDNEKKLTDKRHELARVEKGQNVPDAKMMDEKKRRVADGLRTASDELRHVSNEAALKKVELAEKKARLEKIADEQISAGELRKAINELKMQGNALIRHLKPFLDFQNE